MKMYWGVEVSLHTLTSALHRSEWSASHSSHFTPGERDPGIHCTGGWVGPRASFDRCQKGT